MVQKNWAKNFAERQMFEKSTPGLGSVLTYIEIFVDQYKNFSILNLKSNKTEFEILFLNEASFETLTLCMNDFWISNKNDFWSLSSSSAENTISISCDFLVWISNRIDFLISNLKGT